MKRALIDLVKFFLFMTLILSLASCVGIVKESVEEETFLTENQETLFYQGLLDARSISHQKIEIDFERSPLNVEYLVYVNGSLEPIILDLRVLEPDVTGNLTYTVDLSNSNVPFSFGDDVHLRVGIRERETGLLSADERTETVTLYDHLVPVFSGISSVSLIPGKQSSSVFIDWAPAPITGLFTPGFFDPAYYEVTVISSAGGLANINNPNYTGSDRRVIRVPSGSGLIQNTNNPSELVVDNLDDETVYFFQVRVIHLQWLLAELDPTITDNTVKLEANTSYERIQTEAGSNLVDFTQSAVTIEPGQGADALSQVTVFWDHAAGDFENYRVFARRYDGTGNFMTDDLLPNDVMGNLGTINQLPCNNSACQIVTPPSSELTITGLDPYTEYQLKIGLCLNLTSCQTGNSNEFVLRDTLESFITEPTRAAFSGITDIENPTSAATPNQIRVAFNEVSFANGFADTLEVHCFDQFGTSMTPVLFPDDGSPITGQVGALSRCNGLSVRTTTNQPLNTIGSLNITSIDDLIIDGVNLATDPGNTIADSTYCFAVGASITKQGQPADQSDIADLNVRCITPEAIAPTLEQFPGLNPGCNFSGNNLTLEWLPPTGGFFDQYRVFWRVKEEGSGVFSFQDARNGVSGYTEVPTIATTLPLTNLNPGEVYEVGVLTIANGSNIYSESNNNVNECHVPLPTATWQEWTRVVSLGPKIDGRYPMQIGGANLYSNFRPEAMIAEALDDRGLPYEVDISASNILNYRQPPGNYLTPLTPSNSTIFDGATDTVNGSPVAYSNDGIVSLAWRDVSLDFRQSDFSDPLLLNDPYVSRSFGYKVQRSENNRESWETLNDPTSNSGYVLASGYDFKYRNNTADINQRMAFFTDYSASYSSFDDDSAVDRARVYWYRIIPMYNGQELSYADGSDSASHLIRVVLPPPNMSLVHRQMANRTACLELEIFDYLSDDHYRCTYNGIGSRARSKPWRDQAGDETVIDQMGDLLIDRFELGCNYTRGDATSDVPEIDSRSYYLDTSLTLNGIETDARLFAGRSTSSNNNTTPFRGCILNTSNASRNTDDATTSLPPSPEVFERTIFGDCTGADALVAPLEEVGDPLAARSREYNFPGAYTAVSYTPHINTNPSNPQVLFNSSGPELLGEDFRRNLMVQSEFGAVYFNQIDRSTLNLGLLTPLYGPNGADILDPDLTATGDGTRNSSCFVNLPAAVNDTTGPWRARWFPVGGLRHIKRAASASSTESLINLTLAEINDPVLSDNLYSGTISDEYNRISDSFWDSDRIDGNMKLGRVISSNSAKLPPLNLLEPETYNQICETYEVEIGIEVGETPTWLPLKPEPKKKRILRRTEYIAASAWHETMGETEVTDVEAGTDTSLSHCNGFSKNAFVQGQIGRGDPISTHFPNSSSINRDFLITGSSELDAGSLNTEGCVSKYGVQDLIGNAEEIVSDRNFCNYTTDHIFFGPQNDVLNSVILDDNLSINRYFGSFTNISHFSSGPGTTAFGPTNNHVLWRQRSPQSGFCSIVTDDENIANDFLSFNFRDPGGNFLSNFLPDGTLRASMITKPKTFDQDSISTMRNGDGRFLMFGQEHLGAAIDNSSTLSLSGPDVQTDVANVYFNPVIGLPLSCADAAEDCNDSSTRNDVDNTIATTSFFETEHGASNFPGTTTIRDFPINNSEVFTQGVATVTPAQTNDGLADFIATPVGGAFDSRTIVNDVNYLGVPNQSPLGLGSNFEFLEQSFSALTGSLALMRMTWLIDRDAEKGFHSGGSFDDTRTGRYTMRDRVVSDLRPLLSTRGSSRCVILLDDY